MDVADLWHNLDMSTQVPELHLGICIVPESCCVHASFVPSSAGILYMYFLEFGPLPEEVVGQNRRQLKDMHAETHLHLVSQLLLFSTIVLNELLLRQLFPQIAMATLVTPSFDLNPIAWNAHAFRCILGL